jgi:hypothetical protein
LKFDPESDVNTAHTKQILDCAMAFIGAHIMITSTAAAADRAFMTEVFGLPSVDAGGGFLIYGLPERGPAEIAVHESKDSNGMCAVAVFSQRCLRASFHDRAPHHHQVSMNSYSWLTTLKSLFGA